MERGADNKTVMHDDKATVQYAYFSFAIVPSPSSCDQDSFHSRKFMAIHFYLLVDTKVSVFTHVNPWLIHFSLLVDTTV